MLLAFRFAAFSRLFCQLFHPFDRFDSHPVEIYDFRVDEKNDGVLRIGSDCSVAE